MVFQNQYFMTEKSITVGSCLRIEPDSPTFTGNISRSFTALRDRALSVSPCLLTSALVSVTSSVGLGNGKWQTGQELLPPPVQGTPCARSNCVFGAAALSLGVSTDQKSIVHSNQIYPEYMLCEVSSD